MKNNKISDTSKNVTGIDYIDVATGLMDPMTEQYNKIDEDIYDNLYLIEKKLDNIYFIIKFLLEKESFNFSNVLITKEKDDLYEEFLNLILNTRNSDVKKFEANFLNILNILKKDENINISEIIKKSFKKHNSYKNYVEFLKGCINMKIPYDVCDASYVVVENGDIKNKDVDLKYLLHILNIKELNILNRESCEKFCETAKQHIDEIQDKIYKKNTKYNNNEISIQEYIATPVYNYYHVVFEDNIMSEIIYEIIKNNKIEKKLNLDEQTTDGIILLDGVTLTIKTYNHKVCVTVESANEKQIVIYTGPDCFHIKYLFDSEFYMLLDIEENKIKDIINNKINKILDIANKGHLPNIYGKMYISLIDRYNYLISYAKELKKILIINFPSLAKKINDSLQDKREAKNLLDFGNISFISSALDKIFDMDIDQDKITNSLKDIHINMLEKQLHLYKDGPVSYSWYLTQHYRNSNIITIDDLVMKKAIKEHIHEFNHFKNNTWVFRYRAHITIDIIDDYYKNGLAYLLTVEPATNIEPLSAYQTHLVVQKNIDPLYEVIEQFLKNKKVS